METIISKAIEGGYRNRPALQYVSPRFPIDKDIITLDCITTDPLFWVSLGKACGWEDYQPKHKWCKLPIGDCGRNHCDCEDKKGGEFYALRFHEINLTEGWEAAVSYLSALIEKE